MALDSSTAIVAYLALFGGIGLLFVFVNLLVGRLLRPHDPHPEKQEIYECGEPAIGSSFVQFDLRFYVIALVFIIFDVEVAFLFPWATVYGKAVNLVQTDVQVAEMNDGQVQLTPAVSSLYRELGVRDPSFAEGVDAATAAQEVSASARSLFLLATAEVLFFFMVLLIGFAYEWKIGALDWVRALTEERGANIIRPAPTPSVIPSQSVLSV